MSFLSSCDELLDLTGTTKATPITVSGKQYDAPLEALQIAALGG